MNKKFIRKKFNRTIFRPSYLLSVLIIMMSILSVTIFFMQGCTGPQKNAVDYPDYKDFVNDYTGTLSEEWQSRTEDLVQHVRNETSCEIAVAMIYSLESATIEEYAVGLFNKWGVGKKDSDNGILLLVALKEKQLRIEVGYGLEPVVTDIKAKNIIDDIIVPRFKSNDYNSGIYNGVVAISNLIYEDQGKDLLAYSDNYTAPVVTNRKFVDTPAFVAVIIFLILFPWIALGLAIGIIVWKRYIKTHRCPQCKRIALVIKTKTLAYPTYESTGRVEVIKSCRKCNFFERGTITLPMLKKSIYSGAGSSDSSSSSWSSSSDSSSSSWSSSSGGSSSFGGGSSGGGGASGSW